jgi:hypothetical protein
MKTIYLVPLLFLTACSTAPKVVLRPLPPSPVPVNTVRYPETIRAYHVGRYTDPNGDSVMHERHVVYRVEENARWDFRPGEPCGSHLAASPVPRDAAFAPVPVNDAILAEVNSQKLATAQIMAESKILAAALAQFQAALQQARTDVQETAMLRAAVNELKQRLSALGAAPGPRPSLSTTNEPPDSLSP